MSLRTIGVIPALLGMAFLMSAVLAIFHVVRTENERVLRAEISADLATVRATDAVANLVVTLTILKMRSDQEKGGSRIRYIVVDPQSGERVSGNLSAWPKGVSYAFRGPLRLPPPRSGDNGLLGEVTTIESVFPVFIARETRLSISLLYALAASVATFYVAAVGLLLFNQRRRIRQLEARIAVILGVMSDFSAGDRCARIAFKAGDDLGLVARGIDDLLDQVDERLTEHDVVAERIAHELRSPIAHAAARIAEWGPGDPQRIVDEACTVVQGLLDMIEAVLFITDLRHRALRQTAFRLDVLVNDLCDLFNQTAIDRDVELQGICAPMLVSAERPLIERMLANLIDNAVHYTRVGGYVTIVATLHEKGCRVSISDQGPGLVGMPRRPGAILQRGSAGRSRKGTGLGLATAMRIADRHGLRMRMRDRTGGVGLTILIDFLPIVPA